MIAIGTQQARVQLGHSVRYTCTVRSFKNEVFCSHTTDDRCWNTSNMSWVPFIAMPTISNNPSPTATYPTQFFISLLVRLNHVNCQRQPPQRQEGRIVRAYRRINLSSPDSSQVEFYLKTATDRLCCHTAKTTYLRQLKTHVFQIKNLFKK